MTVWPPAWRVTMTDPDGGEHRMAVHALTITAARTTATLIAYASQHVRLVAS